LPKYQTSPAAGWLAESTDSGTTWGPWLKIWQGTSFSQGLSSVTFFNNDVTPPYSANKVPVSDAEGIAWDADIEFDVLDDMSGVVEASTVIYVGGVLAWTGGVQQVGFSVTESVIAGGYHYVINPDIDFGNHETVAVRLITEDASGNSLDETWSFTTYGTAVSAYYHTFNVTKSHPALGHSFNVNEIQTLLTLKPRNAWNQFDELGLLVCTPRNIGETNWSYKRRIYDAFANTASSTYRGLINGITRGVGIGVILSVRDKSSPLSYYR